MRINISRVGILRNERISSRSNVVSLASVPTSETELPQGQVIALLQIRNGGKGSLYENVLIRLVRENWKQPDTFDLTALSEAGLMHWNAMARRHQLTPPGLAKVGELARELSKRFKVCHFDVVRRKGMGTMVHCSCGEVFGPFHNDRFGEGRMRSRMVAHEGKTFYGNPDAVVASVSGAASGMEAT